LAIHFSQIYFLEIRNIKIATTAASLNIALALLASFVVVTMYYEVNKLQAKKAAAHLCRLDSI